MRFPDRPYVYFLVDEFSRVFYVGKGRGRRVVMHLADAMRGKQGDRMDKIRQMAAGGHAFRYIIVSTYETDEAAGFAEQQFIAIYGQQLLNKTKGGELGRILTPRESLSKSAWALLRKVIEAGNGDHPLALELRKEAENPTPNVVRYDPDKGVTFDWCVDSGRRLPESLERFYAHR